MRAKVHGPQSFRLDIRADGITLVAEDDAGERYARVALRQLSGGETLPCCEIEDWPDFPVRGFMLDISRDKIPTMETLFSLVELLADLRYNHLQLYTEHSYAYSAHTQVWQNSTPVFPEEYSSLSAHCLKCFIELVPNQNSFGHMERWLAHERYLPLAELPEGGAPLPWGGTRKEPTSLCPTDPRSIEFLRGLYDELLPNFTSRLFNVGCDETFDLCPLGRSAKQFGEDKLGEIYLGFLKKIHRLCEERGKRMMFWGDIILHHPELVKHLPPDAIALEWGYEADHPFAEHTQIFRNSGIPFYVCPGTSSWRSIAGRHSNMTANVLSAARNGLANGAEGLLLCDWGDEGHWQPLPVSYPALHFAAQSAWNVERAEEIDLAKVLRKRLAWSDELLELADIYLQLPPKGNCTVLFNRLRFGQDIPLPPGFAIPEQMPKDEEHALVLHLMQEAVKAPGKRNLDRELFRRVWLLRNRPGGLSDSLAKLCDNF